MENVSKVIDDLNNEAFNEVRNASSEEAWMFIWDYLEKDRLEFSSCWDYLNKEK